ncbi:hypothetical protein CHUAL_013570 [Chamberlinius hualienensis]
MIDIFGKYRGYLVVLGCFLVHISIGALYSDGNFGPYLVSYLRSKGVDVSSSYVVWIQAVQSASEGIMMYPAGLLERRYGFRILALIGCFLMSASTAVSYWTCSSLAGVTVTFGVIYGIGTGIVYITALTGGMKWFPEHRGLVNGIIVAGFGLGASVVDPIQTAYVNPDDVSPNDEGYFVDENLLSRIPTCFFVMAGLYAGLQIIGCLLMAPAPETESDKENEKEEVVENIEENNDGPPEGAPPKVVVRHKEFYFLWLTVFFNGMIVTFYTSMYKVFGQTFIDGDHYFALVGTFTSIANALARLSWGSIVDRITYRTSMIVMSGSVALWLYTMPITKHGGKPMYTIWTLLMYLSMAGTYAMCPTACSRTFGPKHMTVNYALVLTNNLVCPIITAAITDPLLNSLGYDGMFLFLGGIMCLTLIITFFFNERIFGKSVEEYNAKLKARNESQLSTNIKDNVSIKSDFSQSEVSCIEKSGDIPHPHES